MNIAFNINRLALIGLGVTLASMIRNCSAPDKLKIWILCADLLDADKKNINDLLKREGAPDAILIDFDPIKEFGHLKSLHGDWTSYGRLLLVDIIKNEEQVLYLDADLVIEVDVLEVNSFDFNNKEIAAVLGGPIRNSLDKKFFVDILNINPDKNIFNAGILLINLKLWRENKVKEKCMRLANQYPEELKSVDQTILNAVYADEFAYLPDKFNCAWYPHLQTPQIADKMILHFVGSPKPWDIWGNFFHYGYKVWIDYLDKEWKIKYGSRTVGDIKRLWKIRRSYFKIIKNKVTK